jgi:sirohydrochlorin cobaltochelatase
LKEGLVLLAHGSKDPEWRRPFEQIALSVNKRLPAVSVAMAYLEHGASLHEAVGALAAKGASSVRIVPVFLGHGGHVKEDLPRLLQAARSAYPDVRLVLERIVGEQPPVIEAIASLIAAAR